MTNQNIKLFAAGAEVPFAYGERSGLSGSGPLDWGLGIFDGLLGRSNDYYKLYLTVRLDDASGPTAPLEAEHLADTLFTRIAHWYRD